MYPEVVRLGLQDLLCFSLEVSDSLTRNRCRIVAKEGGYRFDGKIDSEGMFRTVPEMEFTDIIDHTQILGTPPSPPPSIFPDFSSLI